MKYWLSRSTVSHRVIADMEYWLTWFTCLHDVLAYMDLWLTRITGFQQVLTYMEYWIAWSTDQQGPAGDLKDVNKRLRVYSLICKECLELVHDYLVYVTRA